MALFGKISLLLGLTLLLAPSSDASVPRNSKFIRTVGSHFVLHRSTFLFNGFNSYWLMYIATEPSERYKVSHVFREASAAGLSVCRTWAFSDGGNYRAMQISPGKYDERVFQGLDFVISEARKYGIYLILSFVNNFNDFGGKRQYVQWARDAGIQLDNDDYFFTDPVVREYYKNHITKVVTRFNTITRIVYRDDPTIMAWELMNEPRCDIDRSGRTVNEWVQEMASFVKSLDRKHLLEIGLEGFYGDTMPQRKDFNPGRYELGTDFISNNLVKEIDFATIHAYPDQWLPGQNDSAQMIFMERWMTSHWADSRRILKKPLVLAEFGKSSKSPGFNMNMRNNYMGHIYWIIYSFARRCGTMSGSLVWQIMAEDMDSFNDGYSIVLSQNPSTAALMARQAWAMTVLSRMIHQIHGHGKALRRPHTGSHAHHLAAVNKRHRLHGKSGGSHGRKAIP